MNSQRSNRGARGDSLAALFKLGDKEGTWNPLDLAALWRHQLAAPLAADLSDARYPQAIAAAKASGIVSFAQLLTHPRPPVDLLKAVKEFARDARTHPDSALPSEMTTVLYFVAAILAIRRCNQRISSQDDDALAKGARWALGLDWLDQNTRGLMERFMAGHGS